MSQRARLGTRRPARGGHRPRGGARLLLDAARRCRACRSMLPRWTAISTPFRATSFTDRPASAALGSVRTARRDAPVAGRGRDDRASDVRRTTYAAAPQRSSGHAGDRRGDRACVACDYVAVSAGDDPPAREAAGRPPARRLAIDDRRAPVRPEESAGILSFALEASSSTIWAPYWMKRMSRRAGHHARSR